MIKEDIFNNNVSLDEINLIKENIYKERFNAGNAAFLLWESHVLNKSTKQNADFE